MLKGSVIRWTGGKMVPILLALTLTGAWTGTANMPQASASVTAVNTITVSGTGEIAITPDVAYVHFGLNTEGKTAQEAQQKNAEVFTRIQQEIIKQGVSLADIQTIRYNTQPDYRWEKDQSVLKGYQAEQIIKVTYRKMDSIGTLLDAVTKAGVNRIENIQLGTVKKEEYEVRALEKAVDQAKNKADALAKRSGKSVKQVIAIQELGTTMPPILYREENLTMMKAEAASQDVSTTINQGQLTITAQVQVTYEF